MGAGDRCFGVAADAANDHLFQFAAECLGAAARIDFYRACFGFHV